MRHGSFATAIALFMVVVVSLAIFATMNSLIGQVAAETCSRLALEADPPVTADYLRWCQAVGTDP